VTMAPMKIRKETLQAKLYVTRTLGRMESTLMSNMLTKVRVAVIIIQG